MAINLNKLTYITVTLFDRKYKILEPQNAEELLFGIENNLITPNEVTRLHFIPKNEIKDILFCLN